MRIFMHISMPYHYSLVHIFICVGSRSYSGRNTDCLLLKHSTLRQMYGNTLIQLCHKTGKNLFAIVLLARQTNNTYKSRQTLG